MIVRRYQKKARKWITVAEGSEEFCKGYFECLKKNSPVDKTQVVDGDKVICEFEEPDYTL